MDRYEQLRLLLLKQDTGDQEEKPQGLTAPKFPAIRRAYLLGVLAQYPKVVERDKKRLLDFVAAGIWSLGWTSLEQVGLTFEESSDKEIDDD